MELTKEKIIQEMHLFGLPSYMQEGVINYLIHHLEPGSFLYAVLCNDLSQAVQKADWKNGKALKDWVCFVYNVFPMDSWGNNEIVQKWIERKEQ